MKKCIPLVLLVWITVGCKKDRDAPVPMEQSVHLRLGNPTNAKTDDIENADNFLMVRQQYALSYNRSKGHANWVSWELTKEWLGEGAQQQDYLADPTLPDGWYKVLPSDYVNSGFVMGNLCPQTDRSKSVVDISATNLMTNIVPQAMELNRQSWTKLEEYCRDLAQKGYRLYIIAGTYGVGGVGSRGVVLRIRNQISVPTRIYKIVVAIPDGGTVEQITEHTPVIAVDFPNWSSVVNNRSWNSFITTPDDIEKNAGVTFFTRLPEEVRTKLRTVKFDPAKLPQ
ncbi:DNA/RNA non-specific endonuclease [Telluribacter sp. SYSU D00476]|uniref:DNA/RNA non-specific endonuclease n=1 Tax=Telluribacter sp. SYSU D00476 TaxID=2811430 RepID=UPI001FF4D540|nr:DNA/RNA non-specific endonuclease [Telluribacter sp. SYSU D00476]